MSCAESVPTHTRCTNRAATKRAVVALRYVAHVSVRSPLGYSRTQFGRDAEPLTSPGLRSLLAPGLVPRPEDCSAGQRSFGRAPRGQAHSMGFADLMAISSVATDPQLTGRVQ